MQSKAVFDLDGQIADFCSDLNVGTEGRLHCYEEEYCDRRVDDDYIHQVQNRAYSAQRVCIARRRSSRIQEQYVGRLYLSKPNIDQSPPPVTFSFVTATWTQPAVICTVPDAQVAIWVGFDGWTGSTSSTVEQAGTIAVCGDAPVPLYYRVWWEMETGSNSGGGKGFDVNPGDLIQASVTYTNGTYTLNVIDFTSGLSFQPVPQTCNSSVVCNRGTAEWIVERPGGESPFPLAAFGTVKFADNGFRGSSTDVTGNFIDMIEKNTGTTPVHLQRRIVFAATKRIYDTAKPHPITR